MENHGGIAANDRNRYGWCSRPAKNRHSTWAVQKSIAVGFQPAVGRAASGSEIKKGFNHIENLIPTIQKCIKEIDGEKSKINFIGVCTGPGSFTGIRIGIAAALGISYALNIKCFGFSVFEVYQFLFREEKNTVVIPMIDAKKDKFFCSFIESNNSIKMFDYTLEDIKNKVRSYDNKNKKFIFIGNDFKLIENEIEKEFCFYKSFLREYKSRDLFNFSKWIIKSNKNLNKPKPIYLRKSEAELSLLRDKVKS